MTPNLRDLIARSRQLREAATEGPWAWRHIGGTDCILMAEHGAREVILAAGSDKNDAEPYMVTSVDGVLEPMVPHDANAQLIAHSVNTLPLLCDALDELLAFVEVEARLEAFNNKRPYKKARELLKRLDTPSD